MTLKEYGSRLRDWILDAGLVLWISRVSVASALIGLLLFLFVPRRAIPFPRFAEPTRSNGPTGSSGAPFSLWRLLLWALPVHYSARRNLQLDRAFNDGYRASLSPRRRDQLDGLARQIPRVLAALCLFAIAAGAFINSTGLRVPAKGKRAVDPSLLQLSDSLYSQAYGQAYVIAAIAILLMALLLYFLVNRQKLVEKAKTRGLKLDESFGRIILIALGVVVIAFCLLPISVVENLARAPMISLLLGAWVPLLGWFACAGRRVRLPLILRSLSHSSCLPISATITTFARCGSTTTAPPPRKRTSWPGLPVWRFDEKVAEWRRVNCGQGEQCAVRPIVVAASGGASRAGFYTAAVLGELVDRTRNTIGSRKFEDQLFAISSVSGSSTGAAFFAAALLDAGTNGEIPCRKDKTAPLAFLNRPPNTWRECMEVLLSGDFLSSTLFAYIYKDAIRGLAAGAGQLGLSVPDRAVVLEKTWESHHCAHTEGACSENELTGLSRLFSATRRRIHGRSDDKWVPLLFFNTTDVDTGRRVVISSVAPWICVMSGDKCVYERLLPDTYDLHHLFADNPGNEGRELDKQGTDVPHLLPNDLRLSTAAGLSARFPFVSPPGNANNGERRLVARVVDGGYFENFGASTAFDIARHLVEFGLEPMSIEITNDPQLFGARFVKLKKRARTRPWPRERSATFRFVTPFAPPTQPSSRRSKATSSQVFAGL